MLGDVDKAGLRIVVPELTFISFGHALGVGERVETVSLYQSNRDHFMRALAEQKGSPNKGSLPTIHTVLVDRSVGSLLWHNRDAIRR